MRILRRTAGLRSFARRAGAVASVLFLAVLAVFLWPFTQPYRPSVRPMPALPQPNGADDFEAAGRLYRSNGLGYDLDSAKDPAFPKGCDWLGLRGSDKIACWPVGIEYKRVLLERNRAVLALIRSGAGKQGAVKPLRRMEDMQGLGEFASNWLALARLTGYQADVLRADGRSAEAVEWALDMARMANTCARNAELVRYSVARGIRYEAMAAIGANVDRLCAADADRLGKRLEEVMAEEPSAHDAFLNERDMEMTCLPDQLRKSRNGAYSVLSEPEPWQNPLPPSVVDAAGRISAARERSGAMRQLEDNHVAWAAESEKPFTRRRVIPPPTEWIAAEISRAGAWVARYQDESRARGRLLRCALAIRAYRLRHGSLPPTLEALPIDRRFTLDPFSDRPLRYVPRGSGYLLYSVGPNGVDDGGVAMKDSWDDGGDIGVPTRLPDNTRYRHVTAPAYPQGRAPSVREPRAAIRRRALRLPKPQPVPYAPLMFQ